jgi:cysteine synthase A
MSPTDCRRTLNKLSALIGHTPLLELCYTHDGVSGRIFAKCEQMNLTGSIKDRMALSILDHAYREGLIQPEDTIVEVTSGNTGIAFAALGAALGHRVEIYMPDWMSRERVDIIRSYGATVVPVTREAGGFVGALRLVDELADTRSHIFLPLQFANQANVDAHRLGTGVELTRQLASEGLAPDAFVAGVGTGGTIMGVGLHLRKTHPLARVHPVEPAESPVLSTGCKVGTHRIQGISDEFIPAIVDLALLDRPIPVSDGDSILMAQKLAASLGLAVGISSGCNFLAALAVQKELGPNSIVATVFSDDNKKYLSTGLLQNEPVRDHYLSPDVQLKSLRVIAAPRQA